MNKTSGHGEWPMYLLQKIKIGTVSVDQQKLTSETATIKEALETLNEGRTASKDATLKKEMMASRLSQKLLVMPLTSNKLSRIYKSNY